MGNIEYNKNKRTFRKNIYVREKKMKIYHIADVHLGRRVENCPCCKTEEEHRKMIFQKFQSWVESREQDSILLIAGDLLEGSQMSLSELKWVHDIFQNYKGKRIFISCGNHDPYGYYQQMETEDNLFIFPPFEMTFQVLEEEKIVIWGQSFFRNQENISYDFSPVFFRENYRHILLLHGDYKKKESEYRPIQESEIPTYFEYVALGHIHKGAEAWEKVSYAGTLFPQSFKDTRPNGFLELESQIAKPIYGMRVEFSEGQFQSIEMDVRGKHISEIKLELDTLVEKSVKEKGFLKIKSLVENSMEEQSLRKLTSEYYSVQFVFEQKELCKVENPFLERLWQALEEYTVQNGIKEEEKLAVKEYLYEIHKELMV